MARMKTLMPTEGHSNPANLNEGVSGLPAPAAGPEPVSHRPGLAGRLSELVQPVAEPVVDTGGKFAYPGFANKRAGSWEILRQVSPGVKEGDFFVGHPDGQVEVVEPAKLHLLRFRQAWAIRDDNYTLQKVTFLDPGRNAGYSEEFLTLSVVITPHRLVPVVGFFGRTKAGAVRAAAQALVTASTPAWLKLSPAHAASARCPLPSGRFTVTVTTKPMVSRDGRAYHLAVGQVAPTSLEEIAALDRALKDPDFCAKLDEGLRVYEARLASLESIARADAA